MREVGEGAIEVGLDGVIRRRRRGLVRRDGVAVLVDLRGRELGDVGRGDGEVEVGAGFGEELVVEEAEGEFDARAEGDGELEVDVGDVGLEGESGEGVVLAVRGLVSGFGVFRGGLLTGRSRRMIRDP